MKNSLACAKCESRVLWCIETMRAPDSYSNTRGPPIYLAKNRGGANGIATFGQLDMWICGACGYTELWARDFEQLQDQPGAGVRRVDTTPQQGRYR